jgi:hypothetical protein
VLHKKVLPDASKWLVVDAKKKKKKKTCSTPPRKVNAIIKEKYDVPLVMLFATPEDLDLWGRCGLGAKLLDLEVSAAVSMQASAVRAR